MKTQARTLFMAVALIGAAAVAAPAAIVDFSQDFEGLNAADTAALGNDGWLVYGNVFEAGTGAYLYGYGPNPAPNNPAAPAFSAIAIGEGGAEQGAQQLSVFSDYENAGAHAAGDTVESNFYKEFTIEASDVGKVCTFSFQAKKGDLVAPSTALAFIKTIDPGNGYQMSNFEFAEMTLIGTEWIGGTLELTIDAGLVGQFFQVGFSNKCTDYVGSGIFYDNVVLSSEGGGPVTGLQPYSQDFEGLNAADLNALANDGWLVFGNIYEGGTGAFLGEYGPFPAPNNPGVPAFCNIVAGEGGAEQGAQQLTVFSDYENASHAALDTVESIVYREQTIQTTDVGDTWIFAYQAKKPSIGGVAPPASAEAFIKTLDPGAGYTVTNYIVQDMTGAGGEWSGWTLSLTIDAGLVGNLFQIGFANRATDYLPSSIIYDNVELYQDVSSVPGNDALAGAALRQNYPNPFNPTTRIEFTLENPTRVDLAVYDVSGRLVTTLLSADRSAGDHHVTWNGTDRTGAPVATGVYHYVMTTAAGRTSRSMILLK